jgi:hypothetical protein
MAKTRAGRGQIQENLEIQGTQGLTIPRGTTAQRNPAPQEGEIRYNTQLDVFEGYANGIWASMGPFPSVFVDTFYGDGSTYEFVLSASVNSEDFLIVTVNGITLTKNIDWRLIDQNIVSFTEDDSTVNPPLSDAEITVRGFSPVTASSVAAGSIGLSELAFSDGSAGQVLTTNGSGTLSFQTIPAQNPSLGGNFLQGTASAAVIKSNSITIEQLAVSDGTLGQVLATDGSGNLSFISVSGGSGSAAVTNFFDLTGQIAFSQVPDNLIDIQKLDVSDGTTGQVLSTDGSGNLSFITVAAETTASNLGAGSGLFAQKVSNDLQFKSLVAGSGISLSTTSTIVTITSTATSSSAFANIAVSGQSTVAADTVADTLTLVAGTGVTITTNDTTDSITISAPGTPVNIWSTVTADSGSTTANTSSDTLNIVGGADIATSISGDTLTIAYTGASGSSSAFQTIAVAGQSNVVADSANDTLTLIAGSNVTITTNATNDSITINATGTGTVSSGTGGRLAYYTANGTTVGPTSSDLTWDAGTSTLSVVGAIVAEDITSTGSGVPTFTSGSDIVLDAAGGAGEVQVTGDMSVSGNLSVDGIIVHVSWTLGANGSSDYTFSGPGFPSTTNDPVLYLYRGFTYIFNNTTGSSHPFQIRVSNGGAAYTSGVSGSSTGITQFTVPMNAPSTLYYQCTFHAGMGNTINIV